MPRRSLFRTLEVWIVALMLLGQCVQATHFHVFDRQTGRARTAVHTLQAAAADDFGCLVCWAQQVAQNPPWVATGILRTIAAPHRELPPVTHLEASPVRSPSPPRAPPAA